MIAPATSLFGAVEAGGTKILCAIGDPRTGSRAQVRIPTGVPDETIAAIVAFFVAAIARHGPIAALGIASFGPLDLDPASPHHGQITTTPKPGWAGVDMPRRLGDALGVAVAIDTDVNAAALAEARMGAAQGCEDVAYVTVGTGIGVGLLVGGTLVHGAAHPEAGHILVRRHPDHGAFAGSCPFHGDCLEGLAAGSAIIAAWGDSLDRLAADHPAAAIEADYLGQLCATLALTLAPQRIVLGGGVMAGGRLLDAIRAQCGRRLNGYVAAYATPEDRAMRIVAPGCVEPPGLVGAYLLAEALSRGCESPRPGR